MGAPVLTRLSKSDRALACKSFDAWWSVLVIDQIALFALPHLRERRRITPTGMSTLAGILGLVAAGMFLDRLWLWGAVVFEFRFLLDAMDGKLARLRGETSALGGFVDHGLDAFVIPVCYAALVVSVLPSHRSAESDLLIVVPVLALLTGWLFLYWDTAVGARPAPAAAADGPGVAGGSGVTEGVRVQPGPVAWMRRHRLSLYPTSVEAETLALFLVPLTGSRDIIRVGVLIAGSFYLVFASGLAFRTGRMLRAVDRSSN